MNSNSQNNRTGRALLTFLMAWTYLLETNGTARTVLISEFMAANARALLDEDGVGSDWIELVNAGNEIESLDGWFLTDDSSNLVKWRLPATNITADARVVVFASGNDRAVPGAPLHTNFKLDAAGGYLALVRPDGATIVSQFNYGKQRPDVSYGMGREINPVPLFSAGASMRVLVPTNGALGSQWTGVAEPFNDLAWLRATN